MRSSNEQKELEKQLKLITSLYSKIDKLKAENKELKDNIKQIEKLATRMDRSDEKLTFEIMKICHDSIQRVTPNTNK